MTGYSAQIGRVRGAQSLEEIRTIVREFPAKSAGEGGVLYSGSITRELHAETVAKSAAEAGNLPIINDTPRGLFLGDGDVRMEIERSAQRIFRMDGQSKLDAEQSASDFLFGNDKVPRESPFSVRNSLWGEASHEFASSLRGDVKVIGVAADPKRVLGDVEIQAVLDNPRVTSLGGQPVAQLKSLYAHGGVEAVLPQVQTQFIEAASQVFAPPGLPAGAKVNTVILTQEFASAMEIHAPTLKSEADLVATGYRRAASGLNVTSVALSETALAPDSPTTLRGAPVSKLARGAVGVGALASAADAVRTGERIDTLLAQDNLLGAKHELRDFAVNNANAWAAAYAVGKLGAELGGQRRGVPGAIAGGIAGGIVGYVLSDKAMAGLDGRQIANQTDALGRQWTFNRREWVRPMTADLSNDGVNQVQQQTFSADFDTRRELDYRATNTSVEIALRRLLPPRNPYSLEASGEDRPSLQPAHWIRDADSGQWHRNRIADVNPNGGYRYQPEVASPERAAQLDKQAAEVVQANIAYGPAAIAARYDVSYHLNGWDTIAGVHKSPAVTAALNPDSLQASDGRQYQWDGAWRHNNDVAVGNVAAELSATRAALQPQLEQHAQTMAALPTWQRPTQDQLDLASLATTYDGYNLRPNAESLAAIQLAVNTTRAQFGLDATNTSLALDPDAQGARDINSPIVHLRTDSHGVVRIAAVTTAEDIQRAREEVRARGRADASVADGREQRIAQSTPPAPGGDHAGLPEHLRSRGSVAPGQTTHAHEQPREVGEKVQPPPRAPAPPPTPLQLGDRGPQVWMLQDQLIRAGANAGVKTPVQAHGEFDAATQRAVMSFQLRQGLEPTGLADGAMHEALRQQDMAMNPRAIAPGQAVPAQRLAAPPPLGPPADARPEEPDRGSQARQALFIPFSDPAHRHHALYAQAAQVTQAGGYAFPEDRLTQITQHLVHGRFEPGEPWTLPQHADEKYLCLQQEGALTGGKAMIDLSQPAPPIEQTVRRVDDRDRADALALQEFLRNRPGPDDPSRGPVQG
jgi:peptidoglycan hydrolase-like protein with peptidoglycan-binding domain